MKKYFIVSDVHGFYDELMKGLEDSGFDSSNPDHIFVSLGDLFDRGSKSYECLQFVNNIPDDRKILIWGNHEFCLDDAIVRGRFKSHDVHNKTDITCREFYAKEHPDVDVNEVVDKAILQWLSTWEDLNEYMNSLRYSYIIGNNIFVHGWVPYWCTSLEDISRTDLADWYDACWSDGSRYCCMWNKKLHTTHKEDSDIVTVFCGHVHSFIPNFRYHNSGEIKLVNGELDLDKIDNSPFIDTGIVDLDSFTSETKTVNVYVLEA